jgi:epoxyqueuosine reductase QueG
MKEDVRKIFMRLGADVCGVANVDRFEAAPSGFSPRDIFPDCRSVVVFGLAIPVGTTQVNPRIVYKQFSRISRVELDRIAFHASLELERGFRAYAVPLPSDDPYDYWNAEQLEGRGILSMRHAAVLAGLGTLGKNTMLLNRGFGNTLNLGAVLTSLDLPSDALDESVCLPDCRLCLDSCPAGALDGVSVNQKLCRMNTYATNERGFDVTKCNVCRIVCPMRYGAEKR